MINGELSEECDKNSALRKSLGPAVTVDKSVRALQAEGDFHSVFNRAHAL